MSHSVGPEEVQTIQRFRLGPIDFHLFGLFKEHFNTDVDVKREVRYWLRGIEPRFYCKGVDNIVSR
jgi:hypothetical protein